MAPSALGRRLGDDAADDAGDVGKHARERADQRFARSESDAHARKLFEVDRFAAGFQRAGGLIHVV